jgi:purine-nucleoside phosphorylase
VSEYGTSAANAAARALEPTLAGRKPIAGMVLGSGLGGLADEVKEAARVPYAEIPGFPKATVAGHAGALIIGELAGRFVLCLSGRFHLYEGHDVRLTAFPVRVLHALGVETLIVSNAAGGVNRLWGPGELMLIRDHINLMFRNPLIGAVEEGDIRFPDMSDPYDRELAAIARAVAAEQGILLREGVYAALHGPTYETAAEVRMLSYLGADAVGMSTVPEVLVARAIGMRVLGFSCIANLACGLTPNPVTHAEVLEATERVAESFKGLVRGVVERLSS